MNYIKLFESYLNDKIKKSLEEIKSEVDQYMYYVTDDFQIDSSDDFFEITEKNNIEIYYCHIKVKEDKSEEFIEKIIKVSKVIEKEFDFKIEVVAQNKIGHTGPYGLATKLREHDAQTIKQHPFKIWIKDLEYILSNSEIIKGKIFALKLSQK